MKDRKRPDYPLTKQLWQQKILPQLDGRSLCQFSLVSTYSNQLALRVRTAIRHAIDITHGKAESDGRETLVKKRGTASGYGHRTMSQFLKTLRCMPIRYQSLIPYLLIMELFDKHADVYIKNVFRALMPVVDERHFAHTTTSCINSALSLLSLLVGLDQAKRIHHMLGSQFKDNFEVRLPSLNLWSFSGSSLFKGEALSFYQRNNRDYVKNGFHHADYERHAKSALQLFLEKKNGHMVVKSEAFTSDDEFKQQVKANLTTHEFNRTTIASLREQLAHNVNNTHAGNSFFYYMTAMKSERLCHHAFMLEQFYCTHTSSVRYRLYQSWIKTASLHESMTKQFANQKLHSWDWTDAYRFLTRLELFYSTSNFGKISELETFGHGKNWSSKTPVASFEGDELVVMRFEYYSLSVNPVACVDQLTAFAKNRDELKDAFKFS